MKTFITIQHTQSVHHTNGMVGSWTVSYMFVNDEGKRVVKKLSDMSYLG